MLNVCQLLDTEKQMTIDKLEKQVTIDKLEKQMTIDKLEKQRSRIRNPDLKCDTLELKKLPL